VSSRLSLLRARDVLGPWMSRASSKSLACCAQRLDNRYLTPPLGRPWTGRRQLADRAGGRIAENRSSPPSYSSSAFKLRLKANYRCAVYSVVFP
jgi:hypothetical protein